MPRLLRQRWFWVALICLSLVVGSLLFILLPIGQERAPQLPPTWQPAPRMIDVAWTHFAEDPNWSRASDGTSTAHGMLYIDTSQQRSITGHHATRLTLVAPDGATTFTSIVPDRNPVLEVFDDRVWAVVDAPKGLEFRRYALPTLERLDVESPPAPLPAQLMGLNTPNLLVTRDGTHFLAIEGDWDKVEVSNSSSLREFRLLDYDGSSGKLLDQQRFQIAVEPQAGVWPEKGSLIRVSDTHGAYTLDLRNGLFTWLEEDPKLLITRPVPSAGRPLPPMFERQLRDTNEMFFYRASVRPPLYTASDRAYPKSARLPSNRVTSHKLWEFRGEARAWLDAKLSVTPISPIVAERVWHGGNFVMWPESVYPEAREPRLLTDDSDLVARWIAREGGGGSESLRMPTLEDGSTLVVQEFFPSPTSVNEGMGGIRFGRLAIDADHVDWEYWIPWPHPPAVATGFPTDFRWETRGAEWSATVRWSSIDTSNRGRPVNQSFGAWTSFPNPYLDASEKP